jgi:hypothetical protein
MPQANTVEVKSSTSASGMNLGCTLLGLCICGSIIMIMRGFTSGNWDRIYIILDEEERERAQRKLCSATIYIVPH